MTAIQSLLGDGISKDPESVLNDVDNVIYPIHEGLNGLGRLLTHCATYSPDEMNWESIVEVGQLINVLGEQLIALRLVERNARFQLAERANSHQESSP